MEKQPKKEAKKIFNNYKKILTEAFGARDMIIPELAKRCSTTAINYTLQVESASREEFTYLQKVLSELEKL